jgi:diacylglycerol kinase (ATP)
MKRQPFPKRLGFALSGVAAAFRNEASFRFQCLAGVAAVAVLAWLQAPPVWWALIVLVISCVLAAELFNSALEQLADRLHPEKHPAIKVAKDCAAGAVLILSFASIAIFVAFCAAS